MVKNKTGMGSLKSRGWELKMFFDK
jgi:hypothetical protein